MSSHSLKILAPGSEAPIPYPVEDFKRIFGVEYAPGLKFSSINDENRLFKQVGRALREDALEDDMKFLGAFYTQQLSSHYIAPLIIQWIGHNIGYGAFADKDLEMHEFVGEYTGLVKKRWPFSWNTNEYCFRYPTAPRSWIKYTIDAKYHGNEMRFLNHSEQPNCESFIVYHKGLLHVCLRTTKAVPKGTQLGYDYGKFAPDIRKKLEEV